MHGLVHGCMVWWCGGDVVGVGKMHGWTTWIGEVGLGHWGRSGLVLVVVRRYLVWYQGMKTKDYSIKLIQLMNGNP